MPIVIATVVIVGALLINPWLIMLIMGALHSSVHEAIPAVSFFGAILISIALSVVASFFRNSSSS